MTLSIKMFLVLSVIEEFSPPIIPASATGLFLEVISK